VQADLHQIPGGNMKNKSSNKTANQVNQELDVEVLYQKLGDRWFAFSLVGDEVFMSPISEEVINEIRNTTPAPNVGRDETV
jgi:hypothetical protein